MEPSQRYCNNVQKVIELGYCSACGACKGVCKFEAINIVENSAGFLQPVIDYDRCVQCGICNKICPSNPQNQKIGSRNDFYGQYLSAYVGYATNATVRRNAQSGGIVSALLLYLLDKGMIKGAYVNTLDKDKRRPKVVFAKTEKDILCAQGSYYAQSSMTAAILRSDQDQYAAVLLGCQAEAINMACNKLGYQRPKYMIGLVCAGQNSGKNIDYLIDKGLRHNDRQIESFRFRSKESGGWPGNVIIQSNQSKTTVNKDIRLLSKELFGSYRCRFCYDKSNVNCDIVCGDPWGLPEYETKAGYTIVLARTQKGKDLIEEAVKDGRISVQPLKTDEFFESISIEKSVIEKKTRIYKYYNDNGYQLPYTFDQSFLLDSNIANDEDMAIIDAQKRFYFADEEKVKKMIMDKSNEIQDKLTRIRFKRIKNRLNYYINRIIVKK